MKRDVNIDSSASVACCERVQQTALTCFCCDGRYTIIKNGRQRLYMPNSKFLTSEFMVLDPKTKDNSSRAGLGPGARRRDPSQEGMQQQPRGDMARSSEPGMGHGRWGEELQRQRIMSASRSASPCIAALGDFFVGGQGAEVHLMLSHGSSVCHPSIQAGLPCFYHVFVDPIVSLPKTKTHCYFASCR